MTKLLRLSQEIENMAKKRSSAVIKCELQFARQEAAARPTPHNLMLYHKLRTALEKKGNK